MNNNNFAIARYLRDRGLPVHVYSFPSDGWHFTPDSDTYQDNSLETCTTLPFSAANFSQYLKITQSDLSKYFSKKDLVIGCGYAPAILAKSRLHLDIFSPYGSDVYDAVKLRFSSNPKITLASNLIALMQRKGIHESKYFLLPKGANVYKECLKKISPSTPFIELVKPILYQPDYAFEKAPHNLSKSKYWNAISALRAKKRLSPYFAYSSMLGQFNGFEL